MMINLLLIACVFFATLSQSIATHIVGRDFSVKHVSGNDFEVTLKLFRDCNGLAGFDPTINVGIYDPVSNVMLSSFSMDLQYKDSLELAGENCDDPPSICVENGVYITIVNIAPNANGYYFSWDRCCRNHSIVNIMNPGQAGMTFYLEMPDAALQNSSPHFVNDPLPYMCEGQPFKYDFSAFDPDGDSLVYRLANPLSGNSSQQNPNPGTTAAPFPPINWVPGYGVQNICNGPVPVKINSKTGELSATAGASGIYAMAIEVDEYRDGVKIGMIRRELEFTVVICSFNTAPAIATTFGYGNQAFNLYATDTLKFDIYIDDINDTITLSHYGSVFGNSTMPLPHAISFDTVGANAVVSKFYWPTNCDHISDTAYIANFRADDVGCPFPFTSLLTYTIRVKPPIVSPPLNLLCTKLHGSDSLSIRYRDSVPLNLRPYILYYVVYRNINGSSFVAYDTILDTRSNVYTDAYATDPSRINYGYYFVGYNICDVEGPQTRIIYSFDAINVLKNELDFVSVLEGDQSIIIQWKEFLNAQFSTFQIFRKDPNDLLGFKQIATLEKPDYLSWIDTKVNADLGSYSYYMTNINECENISEPGKTFHTIFLSGTNKQYLNELNWTEYKDASSGSSYYEILKSVDHKDNFIPMIAQTSLLQASDNDLDIAFGRFFYKVKWNDGLSTKESTSNDILLIETEELFLPSAFSPNDDGVNDTWGASYSHTDKIDLKVFNRFGQLVFHSDNKLKDWNGKFNGTEVPEGTYIYSVSYQGFESNQIKSTHGTVNVIR